MRLWHQGLNRVFQIDVCRFKSVDCDGFWPSSSVNFESLETWLYYFVGTFIGTLEGRTMSNSLDEDKLSLLQITKNQVWYHTILRGGDGGQERT